MLRLTLSGRFSAAGADGIEFVIKSKKAKALLAYLALSPRMSRSREEIMALLWSDRGEAQARASLRQVLVGLRKDLGEEAVAAMIVTNEAVALNPENGEEKPKAVAVIDEDSCIGCTLCIQACPVDAIVGAAKLMHTVIEAECTGCDLCLPPCPVDCIDMITRSGSPGEWTWPRPAGAEHGAVAPVAGGLPAEAS